MTARLAAGVLAGALLRRVVAEGGNGTVLARGDPTAGAILLICCDRGETRLLLERVASSEGSQWAAAGPRGVADKAILDPYLERRRRNDPDLWLIELDIAGVERFAAELIASP